MDSEEAIRLLTHKGVKATANRILVLKALHDSHRPMTLSNLEDMLPDLDKSSIFRTLTLFLSNDVAHAFEDGRGILNYEMCSIEGLCNHSDEHIHFYCECCHQSFCLENQHIQAITIPEGFVSHSISFVIKGICPKCNKNYQL